MTRQEEKRKTLEREQARKQKRNPNKKNRKQEYKPPRQYKAHADIEVE